MPYLDENPKRNRKNKSKDIALDKFGIPNESGKRKKKNDKINGREKQNPFVRFAVNTFPQADDSGGEKFRKIFLIIAVVALAGALVFLGQQIYQIGKGGDTNKTLAEIAGSPILSNTSVYHQPNYLATPMLSIPEGPGTEEPEVEDLSPVVNEPLYIDFNELRSINPDTKAWIKITDTMVNNVVVQSNDNDYYLKHDFYGNESISGTIFSSYLNRWDGTDNNIILYGHNMLSGDFFAYVMHYVPDDWSTEPIAFYKKHPTVMLATPENGSETYKIFAGMVCNTKNEYGEVFDYTTKTQFYGVDDFNNYILEVMDRSWFFTDVDITYGDQLLTLSTCYWPLGEEIDTRWVLLARKVRPGESEEVDTSVAVRNYNPKLFDYYYQQIGGSWAGRTWDTSKLLSYYG